MYAHTIACAQGLVFPASGLPTSYACSQSTADVEVLDVTIKATAVRTQGSGCPLGQPIFLDVQVLSDTIKATAGARMKGKKHVNQPHGSCSYQHCNMII